MISKQEIADSGIATVATVNRKVSAVAAELSAVVASVATLQTKLANVLLPAEVAGYLGQTDLDALMTIAAKAQIALAEVQRTQQGLLTVAANLNNALSTRDQLLDESIASIIERIDGLDNNQAVMIDQHTELAARLGKVEEGNAMFPAGASRKEFTGQFTDLGETAQDVLAPATGQRLWLSAIMVTGFTASGNGRIILIDSASGDEVAAGDFTNSPGGFVFPLPAAGKGLSAADAKLQVKATVAGTTATVNVVGYSIADPAVNAVTYPYMGV